MKSKSEATPGPFIIVEGTMIGSISPVPHDRESYEWYDQSQNYGPDYRFVAETATGTDEGRANAKMIVAALSPQAPPVPGETAKIARDHVDAFKAQSRLGGLLDHDQTLLVDLFSQAMLAATNARVNAAYEAAAKVADDYNFHTGDPAFDAATDVAAVTIAAAIRLLPEDPA